MCGGGEEQGCGWDAQLRRALSVPEQHKAIWVGCSKWRIRNLLESRVRVCASEWERVCVCATVCCVCVTVSCARVLALNLSARTAQHSIAPRCSQRICRSYIVCQRISNAFALPSQRKASSVTRNVASACSTYDALARHKQFIYRTVNPTNIAGNFSTKYGRQKNRSKQNLKRNSEI